MKKNTAFYPGDILIPKEHLRPRFSVVACDQFTSQPDYWAETAALAEGHPSALHMILPEALLGRVDEEARITAAKETMDWYLRDGLFDCLPQSFVYLERTLRDGQVRRGLMGVLDLECYDYRKGSRTLVRPTEATVTQRIPPRMKLRQGASLEMPHAMLLIDDPDCTVIEPLAARKEEFPCCYDFDLMQGGGHLKGWALPHSCYESVQPALEKLADSKAFNQRLGTSRKPAILCAVGDGNHTLAAARACWEELRETLTEEERACHPARWALVELCNLHDPGVTFLPIHRAVFDVDPAHFRAALLQWAETVPEGEKPLPTAKRQNFTLITGSREKKVSIKLPAHPLTVGSVQGFLDRYLKKHGGRVDYIHGDDALRQLCREGAVGLLLPPMPKDALFYTVATQGALPAKTFSIGEAWDKRYYLECRKIR